MADEYNETDPMIEQELECAVLKAQDKASVGSGLGSVCPREWHHVLCWPPTAANSSALVPCFPQLNGIHYNTSGNVSRACGADGSWAPLIDYAGCREVAGGEAVELLTPVELTSLLYAVGYAVSLLALAFAVFIFVYFKDLRCLRNTIHTNLMATYMLSDTVWMLTHPIQLYQSNEGSPGHACTVAILTLNIVLHYLYLTNFFWMFVEGLYLYMLVVKTFARQNLKLRAYAAIGWGVPLVVVLAWVLAKSLLTSHPHPLSEAPLEAHLITSMMPQCPLLLPDVFDWIYQVPMLFVLILNIAFLSSIMWVLITKLRSATNMETQQYRKAAKALLVLIPLLGGTYVLFLDAPTEDHIASVYHNVRAVLLSMQGFLVALLYCFLNSEVQNTFRHHMAQWKEARELATGHRYSSASSTQAETARLFNPSKFFKRKRQMSMSEATTMTVLSQSAGHAQTHGRASGSGGGEAHYEHT